MTIDFICEELAELFDSPCNYSPMDEKMFQDSYCESHCGKITDKECWKRYFEKVWADRKTEPQRGCDADCNEDCTECAKEWQDWKDQMWTEAVIASKTEPQTCDTCKWGEWYRKGYDITMMSDECGGCCSWNSKWTPKDEPQTDCSWK